MKDVLTTYEAALKYKLTTVYIRRLMSQGRIVGRLAHINKSGQMWLIDAKSLELFMKNRPSPGRPPKKPI